LTAPIVGHVGDGNFHLVVLFDPNDPSEREKAETLAKKVSQRAIAMGGTCTGEHGVGSGKIAFVEKELGGAVDVMRAIKQALDPRNFMNPGKIFRPRPVEAERRL
jgi:D-lactate dehydrogenase (cytochrome)